jgi:hypothetical protein
MPLSMTVSGLLVEDEYGAVGIATVAAIAFLTAIARRIRRFFRASVSSPPPPANARRFRS